ncbi:MAG TPA: class I SAM-dependent methyltransferase [Malonomonas sp.]
MKETQTDWNARWREKAVTANWQADSWLQRVRAYLPEGSALDIACGMGRNAIYLAEQGFAVTAVDMSEVALSYLKEEAQRRGLEIEITHIDLETAPVLPTGPFDLLLNFFYLHRPLLPLELEQVRPGGVAVFRTFSSAGSEQFGPIRQDIALHPGELLEIFAGWEILFHEEGLEPSAKGGSLAGIVARKPI